MPAGGGVAVRIVFDPVRPFLVQSDLVRFVRFGPVRSGSVRFGPVRLSPVRSGSVQSGSVRFGRCSLVGLFWLGFSSPCAIWLGLGRNSLFGHNYLLAMHQNPFGVLSPSKKQFAAIYFPTEGEQRHPRFNSCHGRGAKGEMPEQISLVQLGGRAKSRHKSNA